FEAALVSPRGGYNPDHLLDSTMLGKELRVRNWRAGDRFWPAHTKSPKKIKELLQELHITGSERKLWPVVVQGADVVWVRGFPVPCQFIKPRYRQQSGKGPGDFLEIFFSHEPDIKGEHVLLVEGLLHSGVTSEFLMNDLRARGAASVKLATLLDRQSARRVQLQPDYFGFLVDEAFLVGYGLGSPQQVNRNLSYLAATNQAVPMT